MAGLIRCLCGHMYDPESLPACPACGRERKSPRAPKAVPPPPVQPAPAEKPAPGTPAPPAQTAPGWIWKLGAASIGLLLLITVVSSLFDPDHPGEGETTVPATTRQAETELSQAAVCREALGKWNWFTGGFVTFADDGRAFFQPTEDAPPAVHAQWQCDPSTGSYTVSWSNGFTETIRVYQNGNLISGSNNVGVEVSGSRYIDPTAGMPPLQFKQSGSRQIPYKLPQLLQTADSVAANWRADAYAVGLRIRQDGFPNKGSHYVQIEYYSPSEGTGLWVSSHRGRNQVMEAGSVNWGVEPLPAEFIDFPDAVKIARENGLRGLISRAELRMDSGWRPAQAVWRISADTHGVHPPPIHAVTGQVMSR